MKSGKPNELSFIFSMSTRIVACDIDSQTRTFSLCGGNSDLTCNLNKSDGKCVYVYVASHDFHDFGVRNLPNKHLKLSPTQKFTPVPCFCSASAEVFSGKTEPSEDGMKMKSMKSWQLMIYYIITSCRLNHPLEKYARRIKK